MRDHNRMNRFHIKRMKHNAKRKARREGLRKFSQQQGQKTFSTWA